MLSFYDIYKTLSNAEALYLIEVHSLKIISYRFQTISHRQQAILRKHCKWYCDDIYEPSPPATAFGAFRTPCFLFFIIG